MQTEHWFPSLIGKTCDLNIAEQMANDVHDCWDEQQVHENWIIHYTKYMLPVGQLKCPQALKS